MPELRLLLECFLSCCASAITAPIRRENPGSPEIRSGLYKIVKNKMRERTAQKITELILMALPAIARSIGLFSLRIALTPPGSLIMSNAEAAWPPTQESGSLRAAISSSFLANNDSFRAGVILALYATLQGERRGCVNAVMVWRLPESIRL